MTGARLPVTLQAEINRSDTMKKTFTKKHDQADGTRYCLFEYPGKFVVSWSYRRGATMHSQEFTSFDERAEFLKTSTFDNALKVESHITT